MTEIHTKLIGSGTLDDPFRVNLPHYRMIGNPDYKNMTATVAVPDDEVTKDMRSPDKEKIRNKYRGQPAWDKDDVASDV